eukprot:6471893-Amphidinium_carterae.1
MAVAHAAIMPMYQVSKSNSEVALVLHMFVVSAKLGLSQMTCCAFRSKSAAGARFSRNYDFMFMTETVGLQVCTTASVNKALARAPAL